MGMDAARRARAARVLMPSCIRVDGELRTVIETIGYQPSIGHYAKVVRWSKDFNRVVVSRGPRGPWRVWTPDDVFSAVPRISPSRPSSGRSYFAPSGRRTFAPSCHRPFRQPAPTTFAAHCTSENVENHPVCRSWLGMAGLFLCLRFLWPTPI